MIDGYAYILPCKKWVNIGFYQGAELADPDRLLEGTGARMRHIKVRSVEDASRPALRALVREARKRRGESTR